MRSIGRSPTKWEGGSQRYFVVVQSEVDAALISFFQLFRQLDELFDHFLRRDRAVVVRVQRFLKHLGKFAALDEVSFRADFDRARETARSTQDN
jgi:hypothetical protein